MTPDRRDRSDRVRKPSHSNFGVSITWPTADGKLSEARLQEVHEHGVEFTQAFLRPGGKELEVEEMCCPPRERNPDGTLKYKDGMKNLDGGLKPCKKPAAAPPAFKFPVGEPPVGEPL